MSTEQNNGKPAVPPKRNLLNDRRIRLLLSLLGAVIAWMAVTIVVQPGTTTTIYNVPVDFSYDSAAYTSRGLSIVNAEEKTVNLKLSGDGYTIGSLSANDFVVYPDWSSVRDSGEKSLRLQVRSQSTLLTGVSVSIDGDNTVDVVIVDTSGKPASSTLVKAVQDHIDPDSQGLGMGEAPIGAYCYVSAATGFYLPISLQVTALPGSVQAEVTQAVKDAVTAYLTSIAFRQDYVSYAQIAAAILSAPGVEDFANLTVNGGTANIAIADRKVAVLGEVTVTYAG